jgi:2-iminobutanoate/2-iminopropanoate deaminase
VGPRVLGDLCHQVEHVTKDFAAMNGIYAKHFGEHRPARSTVAVKARPRNTLVEIEAIARVGE